VIVVGESKGAELALTLASRKPEITGVVAFVPSAVVFQGIPKVYWPPRSSWSVGGEPLPFVPYDLTGLADPSDVFAIYRNSLGQAAAVQAATIPVERIKGPVLLFSAGQDAMWPSFDMSETIMGALRRPSFAYPSEHVSYADAGHTMTEYYLMGGTPEGNQAARLDSTARMLAFLERFSAE
jgi:dienelactone hydrolase